MEYKDYYKTLGVARNASQDEIKRAFRKLARKYHPDVSKEPDAEARFKEINEANEVLKDPEKRAAYDALGDQWRAGQEFRPPPGGETWQREFHFRPGEAAEFSDFFSSLFGGGLGRGAEDLFRRTGQDQTARVRISLEEAYHGATRELRLETPEIGKDGRVTSRSRTLRVRIPAGVTQGQQIRLAGQGTPGIGGGPAGDLYLEVDLAPHPLFETEGRDVLLRLPIAPWEAALGASVKVPTLAGAVTLKVPAGSQTGQRLRLKGRGLPGSPPGDEYVLFEIVVPPADTEAAREEYRRMAAAFAFDPRAKLRV
jgi:curved DNA-binding protein